MTTLLRHRLDQGAGAFEALADQIEIIVKATPEEADDYDYQATIAATIRAFHSIEEDQRVGFLAGLASFLTSLVEVGEPHFPMDRSHHRHLDQQQMDQVIGKGCAARDRFISFCPGGIGGGRGFMISDEAIYSLQGDLPAFLGCILTHNPASIRAEGIEDALLADETRKTFISGRFFSENEYGEAIMELKKGLLDLIEVTR